MSIHTITWMNLRDILLNEGRPTQKAACCIILIKSQSGKGKIREIEKRSVVIRGSLIEGVRALWENV